MHPGPTIHQDRPRADVLHNCLHISPLWAHKTPQPTSLLSFVLLSSSLTYFSKQGLVIFLSCISPAQATTEAEALRGEVCEEALGRRAQQRGHAPLAGLHTLLPCSLHTQGAAVGTLCFTHVSPCAWSLTEAGSKLQARSLLTCTLLRCVGGVAAHNTTESRGYCGGET